MEDATQNAHPVENSAPASQQAISVTLTDGRVVDDEHAVRWFAPRNQTWVYEVEVEGKLYLGKMLEDGKVQLL